MASTWTENNVATSFGVIQSVSSLNRTLVDICFYHLEDWITRCNYCKKSLKIIRKISKNYPINNRNLPNRYLANADIKPIAT